MDLNTKIPPPPRVPKGLIALVGRPRPPAATPPPDPKVEPPPPAAGTEEQTRTWRPERSRRELVPRLQASAGFADAAEERTVIGRVNLHDPRVFRSEPPKPEVASAEPAIASAEPDELAEAEDATLEGTTIEFVGALSGFGRKGAAAAAPDAPTAPTPVGPSAWVSDEKTTLYKPERPFVAREEPTEEFELDESTTEPLPGPRKVIVSAAVLAGLPADAARAERTKKRRGRRALGTKVGAALCLLGALALLLSAAWRYPRALPTAHGALLRAAAMVSKP